MKLFFLVIGLILIIEGLPYFAFPHKMKAWMQRIQEVPDNHLRIMGLIAMGLGWAVVYLCRQ